MNRLILCFPICGIQNELRVVINQQKTFDNIDKCRHYINDIRTERLVMVSDEKFGKEFVSTMDKWEKISVIYVYGKHDVHNAEMSVLQQNVSKTDLK